MRLLDVLELVLHRLQLLVQLVLLLQLRLVLGLQLLQLLIVLSLHGLELLALVGDESLLLADLLLLLGDLILELLSLLLLLLLDVHHLRLKVFLVLLHLRYLVLLVLQLLLRIIKLLFLIVQAVDLSLQLVGLLLLDHLDVPLRYLLDLAEAGVAEAVAHQGDLGQGRVLVKGLQKDGLDGLTEEVVLEFDDTDLFVELEGIDEVDEAGVIEAAAGEVELLQLARLPGPCVCQDVCEVAEYLISQEILRAGQDLNL